MKRIIILGFLSAIVSLVSGCLSLSNDSQETPIVPDNCIYDSSFTESHEPDENSTQVSFELHRIIATQYNNYIQDIALSPDGNYVVASSALEERGIRIWDVNTGELVHTYEVIFEFLGRIAFSPNGLLLAADVDRRIMVWKIESNEQILQTPRYPNDINDITFIDDEEFLISLDQELQIWSVSEASMQMSLAFPDRRVEDISLNATHTCLLLEEKTRRGSDNEMDLTLVDLITFERQRIASGLPTHGISFSPTMNLIAYPQIGRVILLDTVLLEEQYLLEAVSGPLVFHPTRRILFTRNFSMNSSEFANQVILWDIDSYEVLSVLLHDSSVRDIEFNVQNDILVALTLDGIYIWKEAEVE